MTSWDDGAARIGSARGSDSAGTSCDWTELPTDTLRLVTSWPNPEEYCSGLIG